MTSDVIDEVVVQALILSSLSYPICLAPLIIIQRRLGSHAAKRCSDRIVLCGRLGVSRGVAIMCCDKKWR